MPPSLYGELRLGGKSSHSPPRAPSGEFPTLPVKTQSIVVPNQSDAKSHCTVGVSGLGGVGAVRVAVQETRTEGIAQLLRKGARDDLNCTRMHFGTSSGAAT
ncbi:hypothetical protein R1flu_012360 [Riccia fluitans]|uniref:Uncharacterized protein n=1 Tax=Riccia fluitans TaxID=41844 RepID=A0ABD1ZAD5_9MARC